MRIRKRFAQTPQESLHHLQQQPSPNHTPFQELPKPVPSSAPPPSDLHLTLVKGTNGWICKTYDDDCMHYEAGDDMIGKLSSAPKDHLSDDDSSSTKHVAGISEMKSAMKIIQDKEVTEDTNESMKMRRKKVDEDSVMTGGSRCSRVNGSGWRCWRQAAVGHSLCVHHSFRGRFRSKSVKAEEQGHTTSSSLPVLLDEEPLIKLKKREEKKIGGIKNRSISSLLVQTQPTHAPPMPMLDPGTIF